jgi:hypothetical protein
MHTGQPKPAAKWPPWREAATPEYIAKAEKVRGRSSRSDAEAESEREREAEEARESDKR